MTESEPTWWHTVIGKVVENVREENHKFNAGLVLQLSACHEGSCLQSLYLEGRGRRIVMISEST